MMHAPSARADLDKAYASAQPHLRPIIGAVRDMGCGMFFVGQSDEPFRLPRDPKRPAIILIGDDFERAVGPDGFHLPSVRRTIRACSAFAVVSSEAQPDAYTFVASVAALSRQNTMLIETRPEQEIPWLALIRKLSPQSFIFLATIQGGHA